MRAHPANRVLCFSKSRLPVSHETERIAPCFVDYRIVTSAMQREIDGETRNVGPGDAILIPAGAWHTIAAREALRFLCCCAPPYSHEDTFFA